MVPELQELKKPINKVLDGVWRITLPHMELQTVNVFLLEGNPLTLIDSGPPYKESMAALLKCLQELGYQWEDIEVLILTHPHIDHLGGAAFLPPVPHVWAYHGVRDEIGNYEAYVHRWHQIPAALAKEYPGLSSLFCSKICREWFVQFFTPGGAVVITEEFFDGQVLDIGSRKLKVLHTPGHSMHHVCLYLEEEELLFSGDYILPRGPALVRFMGDRKDAFVHSLKKIEPLRIRRVLPSHGSEMTREEGLTHVSSLFEWQKEKIRSALKEGPSTAFDIFLAYWGLQFFALERVALDFCGVDMLLHEMLTAGEVIQEGQLYRLSDSHP